ncbi:MAG: OmpA family protein [Actinomycetota bacterium]
MPVSLTVNFENGSAQLTTRAKESIRSYVKSLRVANVTRLEILGFTDSMPGCGRYAKSICWGSNKQLSKDRADSVHRFLSSLIPGIKSKVLGFGSTNPVASNSTYSGRAANRRVTITPLR